MRIRKVKIENFKRFQSLEVELNSLDCIVGSNNSGKTTLLQALAVFDFCLRQCLTKKNGQGIVLVNRTIGFEEFYVVPVPNVFELWTHHQTTQADDTTLRMIPLVISLFFEDKQVNATLFTIGVNQLSIIIQTSDKSQAWLEALAQFRIAYLSAYSFALLPREERRTPAVIADELSQGRANVVLRNLLVNLKVAGRAEALTELLKRHFPELVNLNIEFDELTDRYIAVTYQEQGRTTNLDIFAAGSGLQRFIYLFGFILLQQPTVILLDEPDVHLHGNLQRSLYRELEMLVAEQGKQVLFATHSRELLQSVPPQQIIALQNNLAQRLQVNFDIYETLEKLGSLELTQLPIIQAYRRVLIVEDKSDWDLLAVFCQKLLDPLTWQKLTRRLAICYAKGNPYKQDIAKLRDQLQQTMALQGQALEILVIADWDYYPERAELEQRLPSQHLIWHIWQRAEIENYLLVPSAIDRLLGLSAPQTSQTELTRLMQENYGSIQDRLVKVFAEYSREQKDGRDISTHSRLAREYLESHWQNERLALVDAKALLAHLKNWAKSQKLGQFSEKALAHSLLAEELPQEIHDFIQKLVIFTGISTQ